jgi:hypothetical protein
LEVKILRTVQAIPFKEGLLTLVVLILVVGSLLLAVMDANFRPAFADLAKVGVAGYLGWMMPRLPVGG